MNTPCTPTAPRPLLTPGTGALLLVGLNLIGVAVSFAFGPYFWGLNPVILLMGAFQLLWALPAGAILHAFGQRPALRGFALAAGAIFVLNLVFYLAIILGI